MKIIKKILFTRWKVIRTIWPYEDGYGVYRKNRWNGATTIVATGLPKEDANDYAKELNKQNV